MRYSRAGLALLSTVLLLGIAVEWARSYRLSESLDWTRVHAERPEKGELLLLGTVRGAACLAWARVMDSTAPLAPAAGVRYSTSPASDIDFSPL